MLKEASTITTPMHSRLALQAADFLFRNSLPTRWAAHLTPVQSLEKFLSAQRCDRSRSISLLMAKPKSMIMPPLRGAAGAPDLVPGPDVIVGDMRERHNLEALGTQVGLAVGTDSCNNGDQPVDWLQLPNTDHPVFRKTFIG